MYDVFRLRESMKKKPYSPPVIKSEPIQVGVFGKYGGVPALPQSWIVRCRRH